MLNQSAHEFPEYEELKLDARTLYLSIGRIFAPAFKEEVHFTMDGFNHLISRDGRAERPRADQIGRFDLLPHAIKLVENATFYQEYEVQRKNFSVKSKNGGHKIKNKPVRYWNLIGIVDGRKIKATIKKIGDNGTLHFWSVRPDWVTNRHDGISFPSTMKGNPEED